MICKNCGQKIDDGSKFCHICGAELSYDDTEEKKKKSRLILEIVLGLVIVLGAVVLIWLIKGKKENEVAESNISNESLSDNEATTEAVSEDEKEEIVEETEDNESRQYYVLKDVKAEDGSSLSEIDYHFEYGVAYFDMNSPECISHPEFSVPVYEYVTVLYFWPNYLVPEISTYVYLDGQNTIGEEKLEFDEQGRLSKMTVYNYENSSGDLERELSFGEEDEDGYTLQDKDGYWRIKYDNDGKLLEVVLDETGGYAYYNYDESGRITGIEVCNEFELKNNYRYDYDDENNIIYEFCDDKETARLYYDENNVCYKKYNVKSDETTLYEYNLMTVSEGVITYEDYKPVGIPEEDDIEGEAIQEDSSDYSVLLDDYYRVLTELADGDRSEVEDFSEKYSIYGDGFMYEDPLGEVKYVYRDLNNDGVEELIVADSYGITSVFTLKDGQIINILNGWSRSTEYLCDDNSFYSVGSSSAFTTFYTTRVINSSGDGTIVKEQYIFDTSSANEEDYVGADNVDDYWFFTTDDDFDVSNDESTTEEVAKNYINERENSIVDLDYTLFRDYK